MTSKTRIIPKARRKAAQMAAMERKREEEASGSVAADAKRAGGDVGDCVEDAGLPRVAEAMMRSESSGSASSPGDESAAAEACRTLKLGDCADNELLPRGADGDVAVRDAIATRAMDTAVDDDGSDAASAGDAVGEVMAVSDAIADRPMNKKERRAYRKYFDEACGGSKEADAMRMRISDGAMVELVAIWRGKHALDISRKVRRMAEEATNKNK